LCNMGSESLVFDHTVIYRQVCSETMDQVNAPIIAATDKDRAAKSKAGNFRWDLYHRMAVMELECRNHLTEDRGCRGGPHPQSAQTKQRKPGPNRRSHRLGNQHPPQQDREIRNRCGAVSIDISKKRIWICSG